ncbi:tetraspanin-4-like [Dendronephthya gigantea]|uniref:tetraspanin-4-like n=1 Tax=Dendronephthya gigantea TaxID=151771 RepID=UPI00106BC649|nr:tetraspanin-4-like [Dendronephthya gigantea]XP_028409443.1 tetraspanin-4-like [Dendronephthya gigantea]
MEMKPLHADAQNHQNGNGNTRPFIPASSHRMMFPTKNRFGNYQATRADKVILVAALFLNTFLLILACGALFVGIYLNTYRGSYVDLCSDNEWFVAAGCMLAVGSILLIIVIMVFVAACYKKSRLMALSILFLFLLFLCEMTTGVYAFARREFIDERFATCMIDAYQNRYMDPEFPHVTEAWDLFQDRFDCCGVNDPLDYLANKRFHNAPKACGGRKEDAAGRHPCYRVIKERVLDNFYIIGGAAIGIALIQVLAMILNGLLLRIYHKREEFE